MKFIFIRNNLNTVYWLPTIPRLTRILRKSERGIWNNAIKVKIGFIKRFSELDGMENKLESEFRKYRHLSMNTLLFAERSERVSVASLLSCSRANFVLEPMFRKKSAKGMSKKFGKKCVEKVWKVIMFTSHLISFDEENETQLCIRIRKFVQCPGCIVLLAEQWFYLPYRLFFRRPWFGIILSTGVNGAGVIEFIGAILKRK